MRPEPVRRTLARGRRLAKRPRDVQQRAGSFPAPWRSCLDAKNRWIPAVSASSRSGRSGGSEPLGAAFAQPAIAVVAVPVETAVPAAVVAVHATLEMAMP